MAAGIRRACLVKLVLALLLCAIALLSAVSVTSARPSPQPDVTNSEGGRTQRWMQEENAESGDADGEATGLKPALEGKSASEEDEDSKPAEGGVKSEDIEAEATDEAAGVSGKAIAGSKIPPSLKSASTEGETLGDTGDAADASAGPTGKPVKSKLASKLEGDLEIVGRGDEEAPTEVPEGLKAQSDLPEELKVAKSLKGEALKKAAEAADDTAGEDEPADGALSATKKPEAASSDEVDDVTKREDNWPAAQLSPKRRSEVVGPKSSGRVDGLGMDKLLGNTKEVGPTAGDRADGKVTPADDGDADSTAGPKDSEEEPALADSTEGEDEPKALLRKPKKPRGKASEPLSESAASEDAGDGEASEEQPLLKSGKDSLPATVKSSEKEDSGNSGVAEEMALGSDKEGETPAETETAFTGSETPLVSVGAPEQLAIEQAALDDEEDYASFMSELFNAGQRLSPAMQGLKDKTAQHVVPKFQEFARSSHAAFMKTSDKIRDHVTPLLGPSLSPLVATLLSVALLVLPLGLIIAVVYHIRFILTLQRLLVLCNLYLCLYCFALLAACVIMSAEPMRSLRQAAEPNFFVLQVLVALGYITYLGLQIWWLATVARAKGKDRDPILIAKCLLQVLVAVGIGLHYYIFVFERAMLDKAPKITAWSYLVYCALFLLLTIVGRPKDHQIDVGKQT